MDEKDFKLAVALRGRSFQRNLNTYHIFTKLDPPLEKDNLSGGHTYNIAVMNIGAPAGGYLEKFGIAFSAVYYF